MKALILKPPVGGSSRNVVRDFVYGCWCNGRRVGGMQMPPLNELYVASHCIQHGLKIQFLDAQFEPEKYKSLVRNGFADIFAVILMSSTQSFQQDVVVLEFIKKLNPEIQTVLFGSHPTFMPEYCLSAQTVDYIVMREPEETVRVLLDAVVNNGSVEHIEGIGYKTEDGKIVINPPRAFIDLDRLPTPDRALLPQGIDYFNPVVKKMPYTTLQTSRGCPGKCIFCTAPEFYGRGVRYRSAEKVVEELLEIKSMGYREVFFRDETFTAFKKRNIEICERMLSEDLKLSWIANGRVDMIDKETMALMKKAGCHMLKFGIETGNPEILKNYKKGTTCEQARKVFREAKEIGMETHAHIVLRHGNTCSHCLGRPWRNSRDYQRNHQLCIGVGPYHCVFRYSDTIPWHKTVRDGCRNISRG
jgi:radical SAM superfamily enzyme YgiQ (UPF0313 family)